MSFYETTFIARQDLSRQDIAKLSESLGAFIVQGGGKVVKNEYWGLRNLAYKINKSRKGHYNMLALDASPEAVKEMERNIRHNEDIIRSLTVRVDALEEGPSAMMQQSRSGGEGYGDEAVVADVVVAEVAATDETIN